MTLIVTISRDKGTRTMAEPPAYSDSNLGTDDDAGAGPSRGSTTGTPRWVKVFGIIGVVLVLLVAILLLTGGGGGHGPGRHTPSDGGAGGQEPPSSVSESGGVAGHTTPAGGH